MASIALCDDVSAERQELRQLLHTLPGLEKEYQLQVTEYGAGDSLLLDLEQGRKTFDLILLDIVMEPMNGMETARRIRALGIDVPLVFLTASPNFALESYDVGAAGYLLKPPAEEKLLALLKKHLTPPERPRVCVQSGRRKRYLYLDEIVFAESENHHIRIHLASGERVKCGEKLGDLASRLDERFLRCHQSYLVNMSYIADVGEDFILKDGRCVHIRTREHKAMADAYYRFFVAQTLGTGGGGL